MIVNNKETNKGDTVFYIDQDGQVHESVIDNVEERDGFHYADLKISKDGKHVTGVPYNTSPEKHSWKYPLDPKERESHMKPDFYGGN